MKEKHDIRTAEDIERFVRAFYDTAFQDDLLGPIFTEVAKLDLQAHMPLMVGFWQKVLFGESDYNRDAFQPHAALHARFPLNRQHFDRWLEIFETTVRSLFAGSTTELAVERARGISTAMLQQLTRPFSGGFAQIKSTDSSGTS